MEEIIEVWNERLFEIKAKCSRTPVLIQHSAVRKFNFKIKREKEKYQLNKYSAKCSKANIDATGLRR